jgi:3-deoxy-7-phosphoheptulonate synthase
MALASIAAGACGLIVEVHPDPERALSDGYQSLDPREFAELADECRAIAELLASRRRAAAVQ